jgi:N6-L-threonylcarbamoyladenine synthase
MTAKAIAAVCDLPFMAINHLEGHALTVRLTDNVAFPYLLLLVSGGHCQLLAVEGVGRYRRLGGTIDDAAGEAFDKTAKLLDLGYPGGPAVENAAKRAVARRADPKRFDLPRPMRGRTGPNGEIDFSFSGLKTAVRTRLQELGETPEQADREDLALAFQQAVADVLAERVARALDRFEAEHGRKGPLVVAGGVAANGFLRATLGKTAKRADASMIAPPMKLCTDNAAMIAWAGVERLRLGLTDPLDFAPRPRWPLDELSGAAAAA